jgi:hypothetical protein
MNLTAPQHPPSPHTQKKDKFETLKNKWSREYRVKSPDITLGSMGLGDSYDELQGKIPRVHHKGLGFSV